MLSRRFWNHARPLTRSRTSLPTTSRCYSDGQRKTKWQSRLSRNKPAYALLFTSIALYAYYNHITTRKGQDGSFQRYSIVEKRYSTSTSSIFRLRPQQNFDGHSQEQGLWSVEIKQPQLQIAREYTPIPDELVEESSTDLHPSHNRHGEGTLEFWIRRDPRGEVSNYLHNLVLNDTVEIRGPKSETPIPDTEEILFIAGGTGITPALQLAHILLSKHKQSGNLPRLSILWANKKREDCLGGISDNKSHTSLNFLQRLFSTADTISISSEKAYIVQRLDSLKKAFGGKMQVEYYVDEENSRISKYDVFSFVEAKNDSQTPNARRVVMVCGPDGFVAHFAGPKEWSNGKQIQGKIAGILQDAGRLGWDVVKL